MNAAAAAPIEQHPRPFEAHYQSHLKHLVLKGLQPNTIDTYARAVRRVGARFDHQIDALTATQLTDCFSKRAQQALRIAPNGVPQDHAVRSHPIRCNFIARFAPSRATSRKHSAAARLKTPKRPQLRSSKQQPKNVFLMSVTPAHDRARPTNV